MARLAAAVHVQHPTTREWIVLEPGDEPAPELAAQITNPDAWQDGALPDSHAQLEQDEPEAPFGFTGAKPAEPAPEPETDAAAPRRGRKETEAGDADA
ncbi:hypothetical protein ACFYOD_37400 [Streptomyces sp. NPDC006703]|uniref:hypothetical protein n=1 Tax=Streptomyces sp. NPDC006703 TaxID=3364759 RepID=UPI0036889A87